MDAEKIICCDRDNDNALAAAIMANRRDDNNMWPLAMMNGGMNNWMNNPFAYMMMFALFRNGFGGWGGEGFGWNGQGQQNVEVQNQLQAIRTQLQDNQKLHPSIFRQHLVSDVMLVKHLE